jgi:NADPH:quinone reductase-like Zn-dependent oxidoreductase
VELVQVAVEETAVPTPGPGEVLVRMVAAAVNPSDEGELRKAATGSMQYAV